MAAHLGALTAKDGGNMYCKLNEHIHSTRPLFLCHSLYFTRQIFIHLSRCHFFVWHCGWTLNPNRVFKAVQNMNFICLLLSCTFFSLWVNHYSAGCTVHTTVLSSLLVLLFFQNIFRMFHNIKNHRLATQTLIHF